MGLRCLFGHDFGEREVERERREEGAEVVVVYRTVENCRRCGTRRVVSENKEVRSVAADADGDADEESAAEAATAGDRTATDDGAAAPGGTAAESLVEAAEAVGARTPPDDDERTATGAGADETAEPPDGAEDDAVIITDGPDDGAEPTPPADGAPTADERAAPTAGSGAELLSGGAATNGSVADGEAASGADGGRAAGTDAAEADAAADDGRARGEWPTPATGAADEGYDATPHEETDAGVDFDGGLAPNGDRRSYVGTGEDDGDGAAFVRPDAAAPAADYDGPTEFHCPNCGATRPATASSLRAGDVCPDCRKGYVAERPADE